MKAITFGFAECQSCLHDFEVQLTVDVDPVSGEFSELEDPFCPQCGSDALFVAEHGEPYCDESGIYDSISAE